MTNPEQTSDIDLEAEELTDENLEEVSGGLEHGVLGLTGSDPKRMDENTLGTSVVINPLT